MNQTQSKFQPVGYASFIQRVNAFVVDSLVFIPLNILAEYNTFQLKSFSVVVFIAVAWWIYKPLMEWKFGATLGKMAFRIRVVDDQMNLASFNQIMLRFLPYFAVSLSALLTNYALFNLNGFQEATNLAHLQDLQGKLTTGEGFIFSAFFFIFSVAFIFSDEKRQSLHDRFSHTYCILIQKNEPSIYQEK